MGRLKEEALGRAYQHSAAVTLGDLLNQGLDVFCWCNRCGHHAILEARRLLGQMGAAQAVPEVGARLRCSGCASKDVATRPDWRPPGPLAGMAPREPAGEEVIEDRAA